MTGGLRLSEACASVWPCMGADGRRDFARLGSLVCSSLIGFEEVAKGNLSGLEDQRRSLEMICAVKVCCIRINVRFAI